MIPTTVYLYCGDVPIRSIDKKVAMAIFKEVGLPQSDSQKLDGFQLRTLEHSLIEFQAQIANVKRGAERNDQWLEKQTRMNQLGTVVGHLRDAVYITITQGKQFSWQTR